MYYMNTNLAQWLFINPRILPVHFFAEKICISTSMIKKTALKEIEFPVFFVIKYMLLDMQYLG